MDMHADPAIPVFVASILAIILLGVALRRFNQPHVIAYLLSGLLLGPSGLAVITDQHTLARLGSFGVIFLLFFIGMEVAPRRLAANWLISVVGTVLQVFVSVFVIYLLGAVLDWSTARIVLLGFVISLSSTAVVLKLLTDWHELNTRVGQDVLGILLIQDIVLVPMMIVLGFLSGHKSSFHTLSLQVTGGIIVIGLTAWLIVKDEIRLPWLKLLGDDHEMQVFGALGICFTMAFLTGVCKLSAPLGAFVGGMVISSARETHWVHASLQSVRTIAIAIFFVSIGMLIDVDFIIENSGIIALLVFAVFLTNNVINTIILKMLGEDFVISLYGGALLSQIGEFSFVIASVGYQMHIINSYGYNITIAMIALSLLFSPFWIGLVKRYTKHSQFVQLTG